MKPYIILLLTSLLLNTSTKHVNYEEDKNKVSIPMNKPYNIQNTNICNGIFHISFFKALLINEGETTRCETIRGEREKGRTGFGAKRPGFAGSSGKTTKCKQLTELSQESVVR